jgi:hypothetical protein
MRSLFDQYKFPENRLTHALVCCIIEDRTLLKRFIRWLAKDRLPQKWELTVLEQQLPGEEEDSEEEAEKRGLPDAWIHDGESWSLIIESKIKAALNFDQLRRHMSTAQRRGFKNPLVVAITAERINRNVNLPGVRLITWSETYLWFKKQIDSLWAKRLVSYMEEAEAKMAADEYLKEGALTVFSGIPFSAGHPYTYVEAKRVLSLALSELRNRKDLREQLDIDPKRKGRPAITGKDEFSVWDFLWLRSAASENNFTAVPHLTLSLNREHVSAMITLGDGLKSSMRRRLVDEGPKHFWKIVRNIERRLSESVASKGGSPRMYVEQRHFSSRRSAATSDGRLEFDLRTLRDTMAPKDINVKPQPEWCEAAFNLITQKRSNMQIGVGAIFPYRSTVDVNAPRVLDLFAAAWVSTKPLLELL